MGSVTVCDSTKIDAIHCNLENKGRQGDMKSTLKSPYRIKHDTNYQKHQHYY